MPSPQNHAATPTNIEQPSSADKQQQASNAQHIDMNIKDTTNKIISTTLETIEKNLSKLIGDMDLMHALKFIDTVMNLRERQVEYMERTTPKPVRACGKSCTKKPKRK